MRGKRWVAFGLVALAFFVALALSARLARRQKLDVETILNLGIYCAMAGIAGALYVASERTVGARDSFGIAFSIEVVILT